MLATDKADRLLEVQEEFWTRGEFIAVEELLAEYPDRPVTQRELLRLVLNELSLRSFLSNEESAHLLVRDYTRRFPQIAAQIEIDQEIVSIAEAFLNFEPSPVRSERSSVHTSIPDEFPRLPNYRITRKITTSNFGTIYHAQQLIPEREVAIKVLHETGLLFAETSSQHREADNIVRLRHQNIIEIYEVGVVEGLAYYTMPYMPQGNLATRIDDYRDRFVKIAQLMRDVSQAVGFANQFQLLHCDLKPSNILMDNDKPLVADFGLALRIDRDSAYSARGTRAYMAPEQHPGASQPLTCQTDVYGVGAILFHLLCGRPPSECRIESPDGEVEISRAHRVNPRVPADLSDLVAKCLRREPAQRYHSVSEVADELQRYLEQRPLKVRPLTGWLLPLRLFKWARRTPALATFLATLGIALAVVLSQNRRLQIALADSEVQRVVAASTLTAHGDLVVERSARPQAEPMYRSSVRLYEQLIKSHPYKLEYQLMLATSKSRLASLCLELGKLQEAKDLLVVAIDELARIARNSAAPQKAFDELANAHASLGKYYFSQVDSAHALAELQTAQRMRQELANSRPDRLDRAFAVAVSSHEVGVLLSQTSGQSEAALKSLQTAVAQLKALLVQVHSASLAPDSDVPSDVASDVVCPDQFDVASRLQQAFIALANYYQSGRELAKAESIYRDAEKDWAELAAREPNVLLYQEHYAVVVNNLGTCRIDAGKFPEAIDSLHRAEATFERVLKSMGISIPTLRHLAKCKSELARAYFKQLRAANPTHLPDPGQTPMSTETRALAFQKAKQALECLGNAPIAEPSNEDYVEIASIEKLLGDLEYDAGATDISAMERAGAHYERALTNFAKLQSPSLALALTRLELINNVGRFYTDSGDFERALKLLQSGVEFANSLQIENPNHLGVVASRLMLHDAIGLIEIQNWERLPVKEDQTPVGMAKLTNALQTFDDVLEIERSLGANKLEELSMQDFMRSVRARRAHTLDRLGRYDESIAQWESMLNAPGGESMNLFRMLLGGAYGKSGDFEAMEREIRLAMPELKEVQDREVSLACIYASVAEASMTNDKLTQSERQIRYGEYRQRAIAVLLQAKQRGYFNAKETVEKLDKEKELYPLQSLAEYQNLLQPER